MKNLLFLITAALLLNVASVAQVAINTSNAAPHASAMLDIRSSNKGLLIPRLSTGSRTGIISPAKGLLVYDTTLSAFFYHTGLVWTQISTGAATNFWNSNGNNIFNNNAGNVGIGTSAPAKPLEVSGTGGIQITNGSNGSSNNELFFSDNGQIRSLDDYHRIVFNRSNDQMEFNELGKIIFKTGNPLTERMRVAGDGNVGIGTTNPGDKLSVAGTITVDYNNQNNGTVNNILRFGSGGDVTGIGSYRPGVSPVNYHGLDFYTGGTKRMAIDVTGNVGIGTSTPAAKLDVEGNVKIADGTQADGKVLTSDADGNASWRIPASSSHYIGESYGGGIVFYVYDYGLHGLIVSSVDVGTYETWSGGYYGCAGPSTFATADGVGAGKTNTAIIIAVLAVAGCNNYAFAARKCIEYSVTVGGVKYGDWYLPSKFELDLLIQQQSVVLGLSTSYWSSTECSSDQAWLWTSNNWLCENKTNDWFGPSNTFHVRAIREF